MSAESIVFSPASTFAPSDSVSCTTEFSVPVGTSQNTGGGNGGRVYILVFHIRLFFVFHFFPLKRSKTVV